MACIIIIASESRQLGKWKPHTSSITPRNIALDPVVLCDVKDRGDIVEISFAGRRVFGLEALQTDNFRAFFQIEKERA